MIIKKNADGYGYKYTDLAQIHRLLEENGLSYQQFIEPHENGNDYIMTVMIDENGTKSEPVRGCKIPNATLLGKSNPAQEYGSALTYARRYSLLMAYGLATTDDDAESLTRPEEDKIDINEKIGAEKAKILADVINDTGRSVDEIMQYYKVDTLKDLTFGQYAQCIKHLNRSKK